MILINFILVDKLSGGQITIFNIFFKKKIREEVIPPSTKSEVTQNALTKNSYDDTPLFVRLSWSHSTKSQMKINVEWVYGHIRLEVTLSQTVQEILRVVSKQVKVDPKFLSLYMDRKYQNRIPDQKTVLWAGIKNCSTIYLKITGTIPKPEICKLTEPIDVYKKYLGPNEKEMTSEMKKIRKDFGPHAVSTGFIEHRNMLKPQIDFQSESSCYAIRVGEECMKRFQAIALQSHFSTHRIGFLFGRLSEVSGKSTVHALMEPPQENFPDHVMITDEHCMDNALEISQAFGMKCVGMAISHQNDPKFPMTAYMVEMAAKYQNLFGEYFTTLVVMPVGDENMKIEAFQVSDAAMRCHKEHLFRKTDNQKICKFTEPLFVCNVKKDEADVNLLLCAVRVRLTNSKFISHSFPSPSQNPTKLDLKLNFSEKEYTPTWYQLFDFNLLLFLKTERILSKNQVNQVIHDIIKKKDIPEETMEQIMKGQSS